MYRTSAVLSTVIITVAFGAASPAASSNSRTAGASPTPQFATQNQCQIQLNEKTEVKTFSGTIWMNGDQFVLRAEREKRWYHLDADQKIIAKFEGKEVKVTGTLDPTTSEIHVQRIEEG